MAATWCPLPADAVVVLACSRVALVTLAIARRRLGPRSSTVISTAARLLPSSVSQVRQRSRPVATTAAPLDREAVMLPAMSPQAEQRTNQVSPSCHSPVALFGKRGVLAMVNEATGRPPVV